ncbi:hypothetical protein [Ruegeria atlantica]|uniref:Lipoprotein n=1 Tax=Ruegeria atlantica TaxID=81569 RepID=A0A0P1E166_9RHOB|nr:hypothetical protein [Ruegeria atlantica]CUH41566.1 hypothetical protein RUM4293_00440 [Ruegeria atlantica]
MTKVLAALALATSATSANAVQTCHLEPVHAPDRNQGPATLVLAGDTALLDNKFATRKFECLLAHECKEIGEEGPGKLDLTFDGYVLSLRYYGGTLFGTSLYEIVDCQGQR